jgi:hypothetical protein
MILFSVFWAVLENIFLYLFSFLVGCCNFQSIYKTALGHLNDNSHASLNNLKYFSPVQDSNTRTLWDTYSKSNQRYLENQASERPLVYGIRQEIENRLLNRGRKSVNPPMGLTACLLRHKRVQRLLTTEPLGRVRICSINSRNIYRNKGSFTVYCSYLIGHPVIFFL